MSLDLAFAALSDPTRRALLAQLAKGEACVAELAAQHPLSQPAISKHLKVLEKAGLIETRVAAQSRPRRLVPQRLAQAEACLAAFRADWDARLGNLDRLVTAQDQQKEHPDDPIRFRHRPRKP